MSSYEVIKKENHTLVRVLSEKLDANNAPDLKSEFVFIHNSGEKNIILDTGKCVYCDSTGLRSFLVANRLCEDAIGTFILTGLKPDVENLIRISMLQTVLLITKSVHEAEELLLKKEML
jgi:anti-sigma B factor antagonist